MNNNIKRTGKEQEDVIIAYFKIPSHYFPITAKENYGKHIGCKYAYLIVLDLTRAHNLLLTVLKCQVHPIRVS
jgi:hypothetical protein